MTGNFPVLDKKLPANKITFKFERDGAFTRVTGTYQGAAYHAKSKHKLAAMYAVQAAIIKHFDLT